MLTGNATEPPRSPFCGKSPLLAAAKTPPGMAVRQQRFKRILGSI
jgi:hypothetical protein